MRQELGPVAVIGEVNFVDTLPKTRSGKIMRRVFKAITTIEDEGSVEEARQVWKRLKEQINEPDGPEDRNPMSE